MFRLLFDQNFNHNILRGLPLRVPSLDGLTALQAGLDEASDAEVVEWAANQQRVVVISSIHR